MIRSWGTSSLARRCTRSLLALAPLAILATPPLDSATADRGAHPGQPVAARVGRASLPDPGRLDSPMRLAQGRFLVADHGLRDPNFSRTVVLLIDYDPEGAFGVVINRPSEVRVTTVMPDIEELSKRPDVVYLGGPVALGQMMLLVRSRRAPQDAHHIFNDVYLSSSDAVLRQAVAEKNGSFRVFAGHAGWAPGQLDGEVGRGDWHVVRADAATVFDREPGEIWPELIRQSTAPLVRLPSAPEPVLPQPRPELLLSASSPDAPAHAAP